MAHAQVVLPLVPSAGPPWNAVQVFHPQPYPQLWDRDSRTDLAPEDTPVKTRQQPGYEPVGIRVGSWMIHPTLDLGALYDSNVFATSTAPRGDIAAVVHPSVSVSSLWERHQVDLQADVRSYFYRDNPGLNQTDASIKQRTRIDIRHDIALLMSFQAAQLHEDVGSLSSPTGAVQPTPYSLFSGDITYRQEFGRLTASLGTRFDSYDYGTTRAQDGSIINQDARDGQIYAVHSRLDYAISPMFGLFTAIEGNRRELRGTPIQPLASDGYRALSGVSVEFTHLISGEVAAGYARQQFDSATIGTAEGPAYRATLIWSPTRMIDIRAAATQMVGQATDTDAASVRATAFQLGVDYELRRNVVIAVSGAYETDNFLNQIRTDRVFSTSTELKYLANRYGFISLRHIYSRRDSSLPSASYDKHQVGINVTAQF